MMKKSAQVIAWPHGTKRKENNLHIIPCYSSLFHLNALVYLLDVNYRYFKIESYTFSGLS